MVFLPTVHNPLVLLRPRLLGLQEVRLELARLLEARRQCLLVEGLLLPRFDARLHLLDKLRADVHVDFGDPLRLPTEALPASLRRAVFSTRAQELRPLLRPTLQAATEV